MAAREAHTIKEAVEMELVILGIAVIVAILFIVRLSAKLRQQARIIRQSQDRQLRAK